MLSSSRPSSEGQVSQSKLKRLVELLYAHIPAHSKQQVEMGAGAFTADHFVRLILDRETGLDHPMGIVLAIVLVLGIGEAQYVNRFRSMLRPRSIGQKPNHPRKDLLKSLIKDETLEQLKKEEKNKLIISEESVLSQDKKDLIKHTIEQIFLDQNFCERLEGTLNKKNDPKDVTPQQESPLSKTQKKYLEEMEKCVDETIRLVLKEEPDFENTLSDVIQKLENEILPILIEKELCTCDSPYDIRQATLLKPDKNNPEINTHPNLYILAQVASCLYWLNTLTSGITSGYSLVTLIAQLSRQDFHPECGESQSHYAILIPVAFYSVILLGYAKPRSFYLTNMQWLRGYFHTYIHHGYYKNITFKELALSGLAAVIASMGSFFGMRQSLLMLNKYVLCNFPVIDRGIPEAAIQVVMWESALINLYITFVNNVISIHNKTKNNTKKGGDNSLVEDRLDRLYWFKKFHELTLFCLIVDASNAAVAGFNSGYSFPDTIHNNDSHVDWTLDWLPILRIVLTVAAALITFTSVYAWNHLGYYNEMGASINDLEHKENNEPLVQVVVEENEHKAENTPLDHGGDSLLSSLLEKQDEEESHVAGTLSKSSSTSSLSDSASFSSDSSFHVSAPLKTTYASLGKGARSRSTSPIASMSQDNRLFFQGSVDANLPSKADSSNISNALLADSDIHPAYFRN